MDDRVLTSQAENTSTRGQVNAEGNPTGACKRLSQVHLQRAARPGRGPRVARYNRATFNAARERRSGMDLIFSLLSSQYALYGLALIALVVVYQHFGSNLRIRVPGLGLSGDELLGKLLGPRFRQAKLEKAAKQQVKHGNVLAAGRLYENAGDDQKAIEVLVEGKEFHAAASLLERNGKAERAAELYLEAGDYKKAAQLFTDCGKPARAAELFLQRNNTMEAARLFSAAQMWERSGELYLKGGYPLRAAEAFEKQGNFLRAAECHEKHFDENVTYATTYSSTAQSADHRSALLAGRLFQKAGNLQRAYQAFAKGSFFKDAGAACLELGQFAKAAELFLRAEDPERAADAWERAGEPVRAATLRGEVALKADRVAEAAACFQKGQDYLRAAELFESVGMLAEAAGAFEAGDSLAAAGGVYLRAGLPLRAAQAFERAREWETAAKLFEEAGDMRQAVTLYERAGLTFKSGEAAMRAGERDKAIALLQRVGPSDENYRTASEQLAQLFIDAGLPALGIERVQKTVGNEPVSSANIDLYYWLAAAFEAAQQGPQALALYKKIQAENLSFRDVARRVARLQSGATTAPAAPSRPPAPVASAQPAPVAAPRPAAAPVAPAVATPGAPAQAAAPRAGRRFVLREALGTSALGAWHRGEDEAGQSVSLRLLPATLLAEPGLVQALTADLRAAAQVQHPNLLRPLGLVEIEGQRTLVSEWWSGRALSEPLTRGQRLPFAQVLTLARLVFPVLVALHARGVAHGGVEPGTLLAGAGTVKLSDVGLGRLRQRLPSAYRPPEGAFDLGADLYAACASLYHLLTGVAPTTLPQGVGLPLPSARAAGVPEAFDSLLVRGLHPRRESRPAAASEYLAALQGLGSRE